MHDIMVALCLIDEFDAMISSFSFLLSSFFLFCCCRIIFFPCVGALIRLELLILHGNDILGPIPRSLSELTNLRDFSCFDNCPTEGFRLNRAFCRRTFERLYVTTPNLGVDTVFWDPCQLYGDKPSGHSESPNTAQLPAPVDSQPESPPGPAAYNPNLTMSRRRAPKVAEVEPQEKEVEKPYEPTFRLSRFSAARAVKYSLEDV